MPSEVFHIWKAGRWRPPFAPYPARSPLPPPYDPGFDSGQRYRQVRRTSVDDGLITQNHRTDSIRGVVWMTERLPRSIVTIGTVAVKRANKDSPNHPLCKGVECELEEEILLLQESPYDASMQRQSF
jgi:hypothetical protein